MDSTDDDLYSYEANNNLFHTLLMNILVFILLVTVFEFIRHLKSVYLKRYTRKFQQLHRVPPIPSTYPLAWIISILKVSDSELLHMVGLDGYMLIRYIRLCLHASVFFSIVGLVILLPIYHSFAKSSRFLWKNVTIASIQNDAEAHLLWFPVILAYVFSSYMCYLLYFEYQHFHEKRAAYLIHGDSYTPLQTYYTVMVENIPPSLQSSPRLQHFFDRIFPNQVFSVQLCLDLHELEDVVHHRRHVRDRIEKSVAAWHATGHRPLMKITRMDLEALSEDVETSYDEFDGILSGLCPQLIEVDAIDYYTRLLDSLNETVSQMQSLYVSKTLSNEEIEGADLSHDEIRPSRDSSRDLSNKHNSLDRSQFESHKYGYSASKIHRDKSLSNNSLGSHAHPVSIQTLATEGFRNARKATEIATREAIRGMLEVTRSIELLTVGANYKTSTTAFVTFTTRVARCSSHQMILSNKHHDMRIVPAPSPKDVIW